MGGGGGGGHLPPNFWCSSFLQKSRANFVSTDGQRCSLRMQRSYNFFACMLSSYNLFASVFGYLDVALLVTLDNTTQQTADNTPVNPIPGLRTLELPRPLRLRWEINRKSKPPQKGEIRR